MSAFLEGVRDELGGIGQKAQALPGELDSAVAYLEWSKLRKLFLSLNRNYDRLLQDEQAWHRACTGHVLITTDRAIAEQMSKLIKASIPDVRVVSGKGLVEATAISKLARENEITVSEVTLNLREQGYLVFDWKEYQTLLDEIGKVVGGHEEQGRLTELPQPAAIRLP